jgi:Ca2+-binding RTX toxin-like protein/antitoxin component YwqK of YwqJK toxin-antitoxin module
MTISTQQDALLSQFSVLAYKGETFLSASANLPSGWTMKLADDKSPPFAAFAFQNDMTGEVVIAYRGTDGLSDGRADLAIATGSWNPQFQQGMDFVAKVFDNPEIYPKGAPTSTPPLVTGHSLGGAIAQIVAQAYGMDGSTIDPGAAGRIVQTDEFRAATLLAGLPVGGVGASSTFTNYLVAGSTISGGTGEHIGSSSYLPSLVFSGEQALKSFLIGLVNPFAGLAYAVVTDQFGNKHASSQVSEALGLLAGMQDGSATPGSLTLTPKILGWQFDASTGVSKPVFSQTEFEVTEANGAARGSVKFSSAGVDRMIEVFDTSGTLQSTTTMAATGAVTVRPVNGGSVTIVYSPETQVNGDGTVTVTTRDSQGGLASTRTVQTYDDGSTNSTTTYPNGRSETFATNSDGTPASRTTTIAAGNNTEQIDSYTFDSAGRQFPQSIRTVETFYDENGTSRIETVTTYPNGVPSTVRNAYDTDGELASSTPLVNPATASVLGQRSVTTFNDIAGLIGAIQGGKPLPILNSGLHLINNIANPVGTAVQYPGLNLGTGIVSGLASLYNLSNALEHGDTLTKVSATLNTLNYVNSTLPSMLGATSALSPALNTVLNGGVVNGSAGLIAGATPGVLPVLGLIVAIKNEDPVGIAIGLIGICNPALLATPPAGWIIAGVLILQMLMKDPPPEAWGTAKVIFDGNGQVRIDSVGESFGIERVRGQMNITLDVMNSMLAQAQSNTPGAPLGIVPQRMPALTWREERQGDPGYALLDIDPVTGEQRYPYLRFDDTGTPFSSNPAVWQPDPRDPGIRVGMTQQLIESGLRRQAIAAQWEVDTARIQQDVGDPNAGLSEEERAAKMGLGARYDAVTRKPIGQFQPIALDLDGSGTISTLAKDAADNTTGFDWDGSGFYKQVAWVQPNDGFLFLDRNLNGVVDSGKELMSNSQVSDNYKGVRSLDWVDANRDGKIDNIDPVFKELKIWRDLNGDGDNVTINADGSISLDAGEIKSLGALGVTELDYVNGRFTRNGSLFAMKSDQLDADANGTRVNLVENGVVVQDSNGTQQFIITKVTSLAGGADRVDGLYEDGDPYGQARTVPQEIAIPVSLLLTNDSADPEVVPTLRLVSVGTQTHGSVRLGEQSGQQFVYFTPDANYNSSLGTDPSFNYVVRDAEGGQRTVTVKLPLQSVNDLAVVNVAPDAQRAIYGYFVVTYTENVSTGSGDNMTWEAVNRSFIGEPRYQPYMEHIQGDPIYEERYVWDGESNGFRSVLVGYTEGYDIPHLTPIAYDSTNIGGFVVSDPDGPVGPSSFQIVANPVYGKVTLDANTGQWSYVGRRPAVDEATGLPMGGNVDSNRYLRDEERFTDVFTVRVVDASGSVVDKNVEVTHYGARPVPEVQGGGKKPIAIDLNGDGFSFIDINDSNVFFDVNGDGWRRKVAWINPNDGLLAFDANGDGQIDNGLELSFARFKQGAQTDLQGLAAFDTNGDGRFTALDAKWAQFGVWQDANSNGISDAGEFRSLSELGIAEIGLTSDGQFRVINGQTVHGVGAVTKIDGNTLQMADVTLQYSNETQVVNADGTTGTALLPVTQRGQIFMGTPDKDLVLGTQGSDRYVLGDGDDAVVDDGGDDIVDAGAGSDLINTGIGNDVVLAGAGDDTVFAGEGNDVVFGDGANENGDDLIMLQGGNDVAFGGGGNDFISGGEGNDAISGNDGNDQLFGEAGWDAVFGGDGNDELWGMDGNDLLDAGNGDDLLAGGAGDDVMQGGAGDDSYEVDSAADVVDETIEGGISGMSGSGDAGGVDSVRASINYTLGALIENLTLTGTNSLTGTGNAGNNMLVGNEAGNTLYGQDGSDTLDGAAGADTLIGGTGDDTYVLDNAGDLVVEQSGEGDDTVRSRIGYSLNSNVENLTLVGVNDIDGTGNEMDNRLTGNAGANVLGGGAGNDVLLGMKGNDVLNGGSGADQMSGGVGDDSYAVDNTGDLVAEAAAEGADSVSASIDYSLTANVENLTLTGSAIRATGNELDNRLMGNAEANVIDGGVGIDAMSGGLGNDTYIVDNSADAIVEIADEGGDCVTASANYTLSVNIENLTLTGAATLGTGNELANTLTANDLGNTLSGLAGNDTLFGGARADTLLGGADNDSLQGNGGDDLLDGGTGTDTMVGGLGNDSYLVDNAGDQVVEVGGDGTDSVSASIDYALTVNVENLTLAGNATQGTGNELVNTLTANDLGNMIDGMAGADTLIGGAGADTLIGGADNDTLQGNAGADLLNGGTGADQMAGGAGDDSYVVDNTRDLVNEFFNQGYDQASSSINYVLPQHVERLNLTGFALQGTGNDLDNALFGNFEANILNGASGADQMNGAQGDDRYFVDNALDTVVEVLGQGNDTVYASVTYTAAANVENLILTGNAVSATGNELNNVLIGDVVGNQLMGGAGNDLLAGWLGNDCLDGGSGNDTYLYNQGDGRDTVVDVTGKDRVRFGEGIRLDSLAAREYTLNGQRRVSISVLNSNGEEQADQGIDFALDAQIVTRTVFDKQGRPDGTVTETLYSSPIETFLLADGSILSLEQLKPPLVTILGDKGNDILTGSRADDTMDGSTGNDKLYGRTGNDTLYGGIGNDALFGEGGHDKLYGGNGDDRLEGGYGDDLLDGDNGSDILLGAAGNDLLYGGNEADILDGGAGSDMLDGGNAEDQLWAGSGNDTLFGGNDSDLLASGAGDDTLTGDNGADVIVAGSGNDLIFAGNDSDFIDAGAGNDNIDAGNGNDFIAGGHGNDTINAGLGNDLLAFNRGDGQDILVSQDAQQDTLSLGGGIRYADLNLKKSGNDLILTVGQGDQITLLDWYSTLPGNRKNLARLQVVTEGGDFNAASTDRLLNKKVVDFDFLKMAIAFDQARATNPTLTEWSAQSSLSAAYLQGSSTQAIGGDLAYRYATLNSGSTEAASYGDLDWKGVRTRAQDFNGSLQNLTIQAPTAVNPWIALQAGTSLIIEQPTGASSPITPMPALTQDQLVIAALAAQAQINGQSQVSWR